MCVWREREVYFKELAYVVVGTGEAKICGADQDAGSTSQRRML